MKNIKNIYRKLILVSVLISGMFITSCDDYLTIIPPEKLVHEDFWRTEAEVTGYTATAYATLCNNNTLTRAIVWGESRSQSVDCKVGQYTDAFENLFNGLLYDDHPYSSWSEYYSAISACNLVMEYGPNVTSKDPNFSNAEMVIIEGEMLALRAYAHFMLLRAFCNIPLATKVVMSDAEIPSYPQESPMTVLNSIYSDLESASTKVLLSSAPNVGSVGRITTNAVYALMADVDMWRAAFSEYYRISGIEEAAYPADTYYEMAIQNCRKILASMHEIYCEEVEKEEERTAYSLLENDNDKKEGDKDPRKFGFSRVYNQIFGNGNSLESIFEFQIIKDNFGKSSGIAAFYGSDGKKNSPLFVSKKFVDIFDDNDLRKYAFTTYPNSNWNVQETSGDYYVNKYHAKNTPNDATNTREFRTADDYDANWIVYRKTDIMLLMAEALVARSYADNAALNEAYEIVKAINARWMVDGTSKLEYTTKEDCMKLVRDERARELCFEGKLWFDIVREALQTPHDKRGTLVAGYNTKVNHGADKDELVMRFTRISSLFMPIHRDEMRFNKELVQNESCTTSGSDEYIDQN